MEKIINAIVDGGKATAGPPLGPALGPLGINAGQVVTKINEETKAFAGMKVPVKVIVNTETKTFKIEIGTPPTAELLKRAAKIEKGAGTRENWAGEVTLQQVIEIAKSKTSSLGKTVKDRAKEVCGSCTSIGIKIDGKNPKEIIKEINEGKHDSLFTS
ncbi:MAG: 50S ribosomal protein L11 [Candidatus Bilamarchaeaceae archaeon]